MLQRPEQLEFPYCTAYLWPQPPRVGQKLMTNLREQMLRCFHPLLEAWRTTAAF